MLSLRFEVKSIRVIRHVGWSKRFPFAVPRRDYKLVPQSPHRQYLKRSHIGGVLIVSRRTLARYTVPAFVPVGFELIYFPLFSLAAPTPLLARYLRYARRRAVVAFD